MHEHVTISPRCMTYGEDEFSTTPCCLRHPQFQACYIFALGNPEEPEWIYANQKTPVLKML